MEPTRRNGQQIISQHGKHHESTCTQHVTLARPSCRHRRNLKGKEQHVGMYVGMYASLNVGMSCKCMPVRVYPCKCMCMYVCM